MLKIAVSHDLGELGGEPIPPVLYQWRWRYSMPGIPLWIVLALILTVPSSNRNIRSWPAMLCYPIAVAGVWWIIGCLLFENGDPGFSAASFFLMTLAIAWIAVWGLAQQISRGSWAWRIVKSLAVVMSVGAIGYFAFNGWSFDIDMTDMTGPIACFWIGASATLIFGMLLTQYCCRRRFGAVRILLWPVVWIPICCGIMLVGLCLVVALYIGMTDDSETFVSALQFIFDPSIVPAWMMFSAIIFVFNLPICLFVIVFPAWRERMEQLFGPMGTQPDEHPFECNNLTPERQQELLASAEKHAEEPMGDIFEQ